MSRKWGKKISTAFLALLLIVAGTLAPLRSTMAAPCTSSGNNITISVSCEFAAGTYVFTGTLTVNSGVTVTMQSDGTNGVVLVVDNLTLNGTMTAASQGAAAQAGTAPGATSNAGGGGAYGGDGGKGNDGVTAGGTAYGQPFAPISVGSGGGDDSDTVGQQGGAGGGAIKIFLTNNGTLSLGADAVISASGSDALSIDAGAGAAGSIWIDATNGTVSGPAVGRATISANGGSAVTIQAGGGGGGGRVAISYSTLSNVDNLGINAFGGRGGSQSGSQGQRGGAGTVFLKQNTATNGELIVDNNNKPESSKTTQSASTTQTFDTLRIRNGANYFIPAGFTLTATGTLTTGGAAFAQPALRIVGTFNPPSEAITLSGIDVHHTGTIGVVRYLTFDNGVYGFDTSSALFSAGRGNRLEGLTLSGTSGNTIFSTTSTAQLFVDTLTVKSGAVLTHASNTTTAAGTVHRLDVSATTSIDIQSGGSINVVSKGFSIANGTGAGTSSSAATGGGHGGEGGHGSTASVVIGAAYGDATQPTTIGSGGGEDPDGPSIDGGRGGGAVKLTVNAGAGTITLNGTINADGEDATSASAGTDGGGGSGGSVWINLPTGTLAGSGSVSATGGDVQNNSGSDGGGGGGGRMAIYYSGSHAIALSAQGGTHHGAGGGQSGGAGTIYEKLNTETNGDLTIDNANVMTDVAFTPQVSPASFTVRNLKIRRGARYEIPTGTTLTVEANTGTVAGGGPLLHQPSLTITGTFNAPTQAFTLAGLDVHHTGTVGVVKYLTYDNGTYNFDTSSALFSAGRGQRLEGLTVSGTSGYSFFSASSTAQLFVDVLTVKSGAVLTHASNTTSAAGTVHRLDVSATTTIDIQSGGSVSVVGKGFASSEGTGQGANSGSGSSGGGHGGDGGHGTTAIAGGTGYGDIASPVTIGSGGGSDISGTGGAGSGAVKLTAAAGSGTITINGTVNAAGGAAIAGSSNDSGGGAGGSIWINMPTGTVAGSGTLNADGGAATAVGGDSGGGGGGRIALYFSGSQTLTMTAKGANRSGTAPAYPGGAGTVYFKALAETNGDLVVDNNNLIESGYTRQTGPASLTVKNLTIRKGARYIIPAATTLGIETNTGTFTTGGAQGAQPRLLIIGTFNMPSQAYTLTGIDVHQTGTVGTLKYLTYDNGTYSVDTSSALFSAGRGNRLEGLTVSGTSGYSFFSASSTAQLFLDTLTVKSGAVITHASNTTTANGTQHRLDVSATTSVDIQSGGSADVRRKGFATAQGTGAGGSTAGSGCGGAHGGDGGDSNQCSGGNAYGSVTQPVTLGSGGGTGVGAGNDEGGGAFKVTAPTLTVNGTVNADGFNTSTSHGGGAGGSIWLNPATLLGSGSLTANGASPGGSTASGGGGGRIAITYTTDSSTLTKTAYGGRPADFSGPDNGGAGTIYIKAAAAPNGDLFVINNQIAISNTPQLNASETYDNVTVTEGALYYLPGGRTLTIASGGAFTTASSAKQPTIVIDGTFNMPSASMTVSEINVFQNGSLGVVTDLTYRDGIYRIYTAGSQFTAGPGNRLPALTLGNNATFSTSSTAVLFLDTLTMNSGSILTHATNTGNRLHVLDVSATTSITVNSGSVIDVRAQGEAWTTGPCKGTTANVASGAAHGGGGGAGDPAVSGPVGPDSCDSITQPIEPGSGGGDNTSTSGFAAGDGGGAVKLSANSGGTITLNAPIIADGTAVLGAAGGGAGGAVWINAPAGTVTGSASISAVGGSVASQGGGGGGGRIAVYYSGTAPSFTYDLRGGTGYQNGGAGTLYLKSAAQPNGSLIVDNEGRSKSAFTTQTASNTSITFDSVTIREGGSYRIPGGRTASVASAADCTTLSGGGPENGVLTVDGTFNGPNAVCTFTNLNVHHNGTIGTITSLTMASGTYSVYATGALWSSGLGQRLGTLTLNSGGVLSTSSTSPFYVDTMTVNSSASATHAFNTTADVNRLYVVATSTITVNSGGTVSANGRGFEKSEGTGQGGDNTTAPGGAYGGQGGSSTTGSASGTPYGSATQPTDIGSGGGDDTQSALGTGSQGGGAIRLVAAQIDFSGVISSNGRAGNAADDGGGAGGSVWLDAGTVTMNANLSADGGAGASANAGCGGGGRIAVYYSSFVINSGTATAATGCAGARAGQTGSVYLNQTGVAPTVTSVTHNPNPAETGENIFLTGVATDDVGIQKIEIYLDGTGPGNLVKTCNFSPTQTPASCQYDAGTMTAGSHVTTVKAYDNFNTLGTGSETFTVSNTATSNRFELSTYKKGATSIFTLSFMQTGTSSASETLIVTFPAGFTVLTNATSGSGCLSNFGHTAQTLTAHVTSCSGTVTLTGASVTNPSIAGTYVITFVDDTGSGAVTIVDDDTFNISASVDPVITFNVGTQTAACSGSFSGNGGILGLGALTTASVTTSDVSSVPHVCMRVSTNASGGAIVTVSSTNTALKSISSPGDTIPSGTATLTAGTTGYGVCIGSSAGDTGKDTTVPVGASPTRVSPYNGSCTTSSHAVGGLTVAPQTLWSISGPSQNAFARLFVKAAISGSVAARTDYADLLTFVVTATY